MKNQMKLIIALTVALVFGASVLAIENHVRWNPMLEECVYFYTPEGAESAHCFVAEEHCAKDGRNTFKDVDASTCYYVPRNQQGACEEFVEGDLIILDYEGSDPDENIGPAGKLVYTIGKPFDTDGKWQTKRGDAGTYHVDVSVTDGEYQAMDTVCFTILPGNHPPVLTVSDVTADEGETLKIRPTCADEDGDALTIAYSGDMTADTWTPTYDDAGTYHVTVTCKEVASDLQDSKTVTVTVNDVDRAPTIDASDVTVSEGETVRLTPVCDDPEGKQTTLGYSGDMTADTWATGYDDAGTYRVTVTCADDTGKTAEDLIQVVVLDKNRPPMITAIVKKA